MGVWGLGFGVWGLGFTFAKEVWRDETDLDCSAGRVGGGVWEEVSDEGYNEGSGGGGSCLCHVG